MTVPANKSVWQYDGNDLATSFAFDAMIFVDSDLRVTLTSVAGADSVLVLDADYAVTGAGDESGGSVIYPLSGPPLATGEKLTLERILPMTQLTDLRNQGGWHPQTIEDSLDRSVMLLQQLDADMERSLRFPSTDSSTLSGTLENAASRANKFLAFDVDGNPFASGGTVPGGVTVSVFAEQLLDDADVTEFFTTLGIAAQWQYVLINITTASAFRSWFDVQQDVFTTRGDLVRRGAAAAERVALNTTAEATLISNTVDPVWGFPVPTGYLSGLTLSRTGTYTVQIAAGVCKSASDTWTMRRATAITKKLDASWVAGDAVGGRASGVALSANTWYHVFLIFNASTGTVDAGFDTSLTAANLLAGATGYLYYRRLGSVLTNSGPTDIFDFTQVGQIFTYKGTLPPAVAFNFDSAAAQVTVQTPLGVQVYAFGFVMITVGNADVIYVLSSEAPGVPSASATPGAWLITSNAWGADPIAGDFSFMRTDTSSRIWHRANAAGPLAAYIVVRGWQDIL